MTASAPVAVTGLGAVSAQGWSADALWRGVAQSRSGLSALTLFDSPQHHALPVAQAPPHEALAAAASRSIALAEHAMREALAQAGLLDHENHLASDAHATGLILGACTGGMLETERYMIGLIEHGEGRFDLATNHVPAAVTKHLAQTFRLRGPVATVSDACASGASAIALACDWIQAGLADRVVCGGVDVLTRLTLNGFASLLVVAPDGCRPFDAARQGMSLGEGAGLLVLERADRANARGAATLGHVAGWATTCDAYHPSGPRPDGAGAFQAMRLAVARAALTPERIDYVNPHGSGTRDNDRAEVAAMRSLFGGSLPAFSSTKRMLGHTLAAAGALEAIVCLLAMRHGVVPANLGFETVDPELGVTPATQALRRELRACLSNSLGFGGVNASLVLTAAQASTKSVVQASRLCESENEQIIVTAHACVSPRGRRVELPLPANIAGPTQHAFAVEHVPDAEVIEAREARRAGRVQLFALAAARRALRQVHDDALDKSRCGIYLGTGLGALDQTAAFVDNMIRRREALPAPAKFVNSVHNAAASQLAISLGWTGPNHTFPHDARSFELALQHAMLALRLGRIDRALVVGVDALDPYFAAVGQQLGWWSGDRLPGEGTAAFVLENERKASGGVSGATSGGGGVRLRLLESSDADRLPGGADCGVFCTASAVALADALDQLAAAPQLDRIATRSVEALR